MIDISMLLWFLKKRARNSYRLQYTWPYWAARILGRKSS